jgi:hypothetical protein
MTWFQFVIDFDELWSTVTFVVAMSFILLYSFMTSWWRSPMGSTIVGLDAAVALVVFPTFLNHVFGISILNDRATGVVLIIGLSAVPCIILYRTYIRFRVQYSSMWKNVRARLRDQKSQDQDSPDQSKSDHE